MRIFPELGLITMQGLLIFNVLLFRNICLPLVVSSPSHSSTSPGDRSFFDHVSRVVWLTAPLAGAGGALWALAARRRWRGPPGGGWVKSGSWLGCRNGPKTNWRDTRWSFCGLSELLSGQFRWYDKVQLISLSHIYRRVVIVLSDFKRTVYLCLLIFSTPSTLRTGW